ncbi:MAG: hypothetical protein JRE47_06460 [Deltaproteobacteria bacterium]|nr:hypothetical protein [Deltaproteobacteria bacterium]
MKKKNKQIKKSVKGDSNNLPEVDVIFIQNHKVPIQAGEYSIAVNQSVNDKNKIKINESFKSEYTFAAAAERFSLDPADIRLVFPPKDSQGEFLNNLPHIIFTKRTLPWVRSVYSNNLTPDPSDGDLPSWMALLLFTDDDPMPQVQAKTRADLVSDNFDNNILSYPDVELDYGEKIDDPCAIIDIPVSLFNAIVPSVDDLNYLNHARQINLKDSQTSKTKEFSDFSVVVGNRLPEPGKNSTVHLVSLEGFSDYLPDDDGNPSSNMPEGIEYIRLASLYSWKFFSDEVHQSFKSLLENLNASPSVLTIPVNQNNGSLDQEVKNALEMGYTAMSHHTRQNDKTVSWYKGPLVPYKVSEICVFPQDSADSLVHYNPHTGMFDVSYSAAWTLGRQIALANKEFSLALYNWRNQNKQNAVIELNNQILSAALSNTLNIEKKSSNQSSSLTREGLSMVEEIVNKKKKKG